MTENAFVRVSFITCPTLNRIINTDPVAYKEVVVPARFISDGLTKLINKYQPRCLRAALVHDYICETKCLPRKIADQYFYEILLLDGCSRWQAGRYWLAVRAYAITTFKK